MTARIMPEQYPKSRITLDGYIVPKLMAVKVTETEYNLIVDGRFCYLIHIDDLEGYVYLIANAMAVAAGYTCHGERSKPANPYNIQLLEIGSVETDGDEDSEPPTRSEDT